MTAVTWISLVAAIGLLLYLGYALLFPERF